MLDQNLPSNQTVPLYSYFNELIGLPLWFPSARRIYETVTIPPVALTDIITPREGKKLFVFNAFNSDNTGGSGSGTIHFQVREADGTLQSTTTAGAVGANGFSNYLIFTVLNPGETLVASAVNGTVTRVFAIEMNSDANLYAARGFPGLSLTKILEVPKGYEAHILPPTVSSSSLFGISGFRTAVRTPNRSGTTVAVTMYLVPPGESPDASNLHMEFNSSNGTTSGIAFPNPLPEGWSIWMVTDDALPVYYSVVYSLHKAR